MLKELFIVDKQTGTLLLQRSYQEVQSSSSLVTGFLQAIFGLYQYAEAELASTESGIGLESLNMIGMRWLYEEKKGLIFVAVTEKEVPLELLREQLSLIVDTFIDRFGTPFEALYGGGIEKWLNSDFNIFIPQLDELIAQWIQMANVEKSAKMMDFLDVIQNVIERLNNFPGFNNLIAGGQLDVLSEAFQDGNWDMSFLINQDENTLRMKIENIFNTIMQYFWEHIPDQIHYLCIQHVFPYLKKDWERVIESKLDKLFIQL
ncbi:MAG: hypothetical protein ACFFD2_03695, partial [Promethearchaeota archaeon]